MNKCKTCNITKTTKWYSGKTECRSCYRKRIYTPSTVKYSNKTCLGCNVFFIDKTFGQNRKYCKKQCGDRYNFKHKNNIIKECNLCNCEFMTKLGNKNFCNKTCYTAYYKKNIAKPISKEERLKHNLRNRLNQAIKNNQKLGSAVSDLGCSIEELKKHLESQFQEGMSWDNYGRKGWHIDHIKPLASFDLTNEEELKKAVHYTNLQPMWAEDNLSKGASDATS